MAIRNLLDDDDDDLPPSPQAPSEDLDARLAATTRVPRGRGRPPKHEGAVTKAANGVELFAEDVADDPDLENLAEGALPHSSAFLRPVTTSFLSTILSIPLAQVKAKLASCPAVGYGPKVNAQRSHVYNFATALSYLIEPAGNIEEWIRTKGVKSLPPSISKEYWMAMNAKSRWMVENKEYWRDDEVLLLLGETAIIMKEHMQIWVEKLPGLHQLDDAQYRALRNSVSALQGEIYDKLVASVGQSRIRNVADSDPDAQTDET